MAGLRRRPGPGEAARRRASASRGATFLDGAGEEDQVGANLADAEEDGAGVFRGLGALDGLERARVQLPELAEEIGGAGGPGLLAGLDEAGDQVPAGVVGD